MDSFNKEYEVINKQAEIHERLSTIQQSLKVEKKRDNSYGKYKYRKAEDILKAVKKLLVAGEYITTPATIQAIDGRFYVVVKARFHKQENVIEADGCARESAEKKGVDAPQLTGTTTTYAKKHALCNLFAIDDEDDSDDEPRTTENKPVAPATNNPPQQAEKRITQNTSRKITETERATLEKLIKDAGGDVIRFCNKNNYTSLLDLNLQKYQFWKKKFEDIISKNKNETNAKSQHSNT